MKSFKPLLIVVLVLNACTFFKQEPQGLPIARVNEIYLYASDIEGLVVEGMSAEDSMLRVNNFINRWATQQLLMSGALRNIPVDQQLVYEDLVEQYRIDLYTSAYLEALVGQRVDTTVSPNEIQKVYEEQQGTFKLNEDLIKMRYLNVDLSNTNINDIRTRFRRFDSIDRIVLDSLAIQYRSHALNDSIWIRVDEAMQKIPILDQEDKPELLKKSNFIQLEDSIGVYLMHIQDVRLRNEIAPLEYVMPTIRQIVINKRKLDYIKQLEKDITKDAIENNQFEVFN